MKVKVLVVAFLIFGLSGTGMVMAKESGQNAQSAIIVADGDHSGHNMEGMDMSGKDKNMDMSGSNSGDDMEGMDMSGSNSGDDMQGMDMSGSNSHSHEAMPGMEEKPLIETPPNAKVLGTYGAINAAFIVIGVWNKWFRRKDGSYGNTK